MIFEKLNNGAHINIFSPKSIYYNENFDLEIYDITNEPQSNQLKESLVPLYFINGERASEEMFYTKDMTKKIDITESNVEYYFDVRVDDEISDDVGLQTNLSTNIYKTTPKNEEEPC